MREILQPNKDMNRKAQEVEDDDNTTRTPMEIHQLVNT